MDEKRNALLTAGMIAGMILVFMIADILQGENVFSEQEKASLASKPAFSREACVSGEYAKNYEEYVKNRFVSRDKWQDIRTGTDLLFRKKEVKGVYIGKEGQLFAKQYPVEYAQEEITDKIEALRKLTKDWGARVMLIPSADNILSDKLPEYAVYYDQTPFLTQVREQLGEEYYIDAAATLQAHAEEEIYYRTDPHWTSLGAYYGFLAWADAMERYPYRYSVSKREKVSENFWGELQQQSGVTVVPDTISYFRETAIRPLTVTYDATKTTHTLYEEKYLTTDTPYSYFLDGNHAFSELTTSYSKGKTLFLIKDSYANAMIPLLVRYYEKIYVADLCYYEGSLYDMLEQCQPAEGMDVLVLYNCTNFLENFQIWE